jgi:formamidopyrimidine-DNA glycosylase
MPELPEVETLVKGLQKNVVGQKIAGVAVRWAKSVGGAPAIFKQEVEGASMTSVERRGKVIIVHLDNAKAMLIHLKLTGQLIFEDKFGLRHHGGHSQKAYDAPVPHKYTHIIFTFVSGAKLYFNDLRKFGWIKVADKEDAKGLLAKVTQEIGSDPLSRDFNVREFIKKAQRRAKSDIYSVLLDQKIMAGLGNIYVNETLWSAKINPQTKAGSLSGAEYRKIVTAARAILKEAIKYGGTSDNTYLKLDGSKGTYGQYLKVYHREGEKCPRHDGGVIKRVKKGGRSTFFCPVCQIVN